MSDFSHDDERLLDFVENPKASTFDEAFELFGKMAESIRVALTTRISRRTWLDVNAEDVVSEALMKASVTIYLQLCGPRELLPDDLPVDPNRLFKFERAHGLSFEAWIFQLIQGQRGGVLRTFNRRAKKYSEHHYANTEGSVADHPDTQVGSIENNIDQLRFGDQFDQLEEAVAALPPRQRFVLVTRFGIGIDTDLSVPQLKEMANAFGLPGGHKIAARARHLDLESSTVKLQVQQIAVLLDIGAKQVGREISAACSAVEAYMARLDAA